MSSTYIAGFEHVRQGAGQPIGSISQMATIRLGKRPDRRTPLMRDFVPLAGLDQLVFGAWDPIPDNAYDAAVRFPRSRGDRPILPRSGQWVGPVPPHTRG